MEGHDERIGYLILVGCSLTLRTASAGSGIQLAIVRAQSRACALSVMPGNNRRSSYPRAVALKSESFPLVAVIERGEACRIVARREFW